MGKMPKMRFYSGDHGGKITHHDVALVENPNLPPPPAGLAAVRRPGDQPRRDRDAEPRSLCRKLEDLQAKGVKFNMRVNHGVTHSVYINDPNGYGVELLYELPREMWEGDIDGGSNFLSRCRPKAKRRSRTISKTPRRFGAAAE